ncbi:hypothetical protein N7497_009957 [Penicillium chrysogenum]|nr:hypothetical protein N7497_009957 [Penicillium chrysogenum]
MKVRWRMKSTRDKCDTCSDSQGDDDVDRLATELAQKAMVAAQREETYASIDKDSKEEVTKDPGYGREKFKQKRILTPISDCAIGDVKAVQKYLDSSSEAQLFVRGRHSDGQTTLIIAARGQSPAMASLLIKHGADVNAVDNNGRTALMEAALFGWVDNVKVLLKHNTDKTIRDGENRLAIDLARDHYTNREERYVRAGGDLTSSSNRRPAYVEDTFRRDIDLDHRLPSDGKDQGKDGQYNACHAEKQLIAYFIDRHVFLPRDGLPCSDLEEKIKLKEDEIQEISLRTEIGRRVTSLRNRKEDLKEEFLDWDEKLVGKYDEIRALELKLDSAKSALNRLIGSPEARPFLELESQLDVLNQRQRRHNDLIKMANAPLPVSLTEAVILVGSPPCRDCKMFKDKVNKFFGLSIQLFAAH